jgi:hypothetical protein
MLHILSTLVLLGIIAGLYFRRRNPRFHVPIMIACFVADISLVLWIEINRHAVETVVKSIRPIVLVHAGISLTVVVCYIAMLSLGFGLIRGKAKLRLTHKRLGITFGVFRLLNYGTAFFVASKPAPAPVAPMVASSAARPVACVVRTAALPSAPSDSLRQVSQKCL